MTLEPLDLIEYLLKAWFLLYFCEGSIMVREKYRSVGKILFFLQAFFVGYWISTSTWVNRLLYDNVEGMVKDSSYSIIKLAILIRSILFSPAFS